MYFQIKSFLVQQSDVYVLNSIYLNPKSLKSDSVLYNHIESISIDSELPDRSEPLCLSDANLLILVYKLDSTGD